MVAPAPEKEVPEDEGDDQRSVEVQGYPTFCDRSIRFRERPAPVTPHASQISLLEETRITMASKRVTYDSYDDDSIGKEGEYLESFLKKCPFVAFLKTDCPVSLKLKQLLDHHKIDRRDVYLDTHVNGPRLQAKLSETTPGGKLLPYVFVREAFVGGYPETQELLASGLLNDVVNGVDLSKMDFDLVVIGGGASGIAAALEAAKFGKRTALCDSVQPTAHGTSWGLGGSPGGSGSVAKDVFHRASLLRHDFRDAPFFGWESEAPEKHNWEKVAQSLEEHLKAVSWVHRKTLREAGVQYVNGWARFKDYHNISVTDPENHEKIVSSKAFIIATGSKHRYLEIKGEEEHTLTVDDVLSLSKMDAARALVIGSGRDGLEVAGILSGLNVDTAMIVRRRILPNTDLFVAERLKKFLEAQGVRFIKNVTVTSFEKVGDVIRVEGKQKPEEEPQKMEFSQRTINELGSRKSPPPMDIKEMMSMEEGKKIEKENTKTQASSLPNVSSKTDVSGSVPAPANTSTNITTAGGDSKQNFIEAGSKRKEQEVEEDFLEEFQMVVVAAGRRPNVADLGLQNLDIDIDQNTCKIIVDDMDQTSVSNIFAVGQVSSAANSNIQAVAKKAAQLLARRMYNMSNDKMNYAKVPILLMTPMEYAYIGDSEETAQRIHGKIEVYHNIVTTPKSSLSNRFDNRSYVKVICAPKIPNCGSQVVGIHIMAPNAGEALQGFVPEFVRGCLTKEQLDQMVGIHPTIGEAFADLSISKTSGKEIGLNVI